MGSDFWFRFSVFAIVLILTDGLLFLGLKRLFNFSKKPDHRNKKFVIIYFLFTLLFIAYAIIHFLYIRYQNADYNSYRQYFFITGTFLLIYIPKLIMLCFISSENLLLFFFQFISYIFQNRKHYDFVRFARRFKILSWTGFILGLATFAYLLYGMIVTRTDFKIVNQTIKYRNLPLAFNGIKILQLSDAHLGSFFSVDEIDKLCSLIKEQSPDMIVFTGDMINVSADETLPFTDKFAELEAPLGKFSIMGNHDQDDYLKISFYGVRKEIENKLVQQEQKMGFTVLRNVHVFIHKGNDSIALLGVDSWGLPPFKQYGNLDEALAGIDNRTFKILLSHIPNHWAFEVKARTNIGLTMSGHTHALQIGIDQFGIRWSPIVYKYPQYMGLYQWGSQFLYINPGFGYLGFPGRIGIRPEITVITLVKG